MSKFSANAPEELVSQYTQFLPNELDLMDSATYNLRFFMAPQSEFVERRFGNRNNQITIAESGVTGNYLEDLEIETVLATTQEYTTSKSVTLRFKIIQSNGANLLDQIWFSSLQLGIDNYVQCPYFLELKFKGYNRDTGQPIELYNDKVWVWMIKIVKCDIQVTSAGSEYSFEAVSIDNYARAQQN
jgi:hypothetical protein